MIATAWRALSELTHKLVAHAFKHGAPRRVAIVSGVPSLTPWLPSLLDLSASWVTHGMHFGTPQSRNMFDFEFHGIANIGDVSVHAASHRPDCFWRGRTLLV